METGTAAMLAALASPHLTRRLSSQEVGIDSVERRHSSDALDYIADDESTGTVNSTPTQKNEVDLESGGEGVIKAGLSLTKRPVKEIELGWDLSMYVQTSGAELQKTGSKQKVILDHVSGTIKSGQMLAIMGSSGAGKSTFLDCVSLRNQNFGGNVFVNGKPADEGYYFMTGEFSKRKARMQ